MSGKMPLVTVVTVCRNAQQHIRGCLASVRRQSLPAEQIEHLVIDGVSTDGTLKILRAAASAGEIARLVSEPDSGVYDAMNKGIRLARGKYVTLLNSDDWYLPQMLERSVMTAERAEADYVISDAWAYTREDRCCFRFRADPESIGWEAPYAHPTLLCRKSFYERVGCFDTTLRIAADYDFMWRVRRSAGRMVQLPMAQVCYRLGGLSGGDNYSEVLAVYERNAGEIRDLLAAERLNVIGFLATGTGWLASMLRCGAEAERRERAARAMAVYRQLDLPALVRQHRLTRAWEGTLGAVLVAGERREPPPDRCLAAARRMRVWYMFRRHGLMAVLASVAQECSNRILHPS